MTDIMREDPKKAVSKFLVSVGKKIDALLPDEIRFVLIVKHEEGAGGMVASTGDEIETLKILDEYAMQLRYKRD